MIGSCIKHIPIAGRDITYFTQQLLREREVGIPPEQSLETAKAVKVGGTRGHTHVCPHAPAHTCTLMHLPPPIHFALYPIRIPHCYTSFSHPRSLCPLHLLTPHKHCVSLIHSTTLNRYSASFILSLPTNAVSSSHILLILSHCLLSVHINVQSLNHVHLICQRSLMATKRLQFYSISSQNPECHIHSEFINTDPCPIKIQQ